MSTKKGFTAVHVNDVDHALQLHHSNRTGIIVCASCGCVIEQGDPALRIEQERRTADICPGCYRDLMRGKTLQISVCRIKG